MIHGPCFYFLSSLDARLKISAIGSSRPGMWTRSAGSKYDCSNWDRLLAWIQKRDVFRWSLLQRHGVSEVAQINLSGTWHLLDQTVRAKLTHISQCLSLPRGATSDLMGVFSPSVALSFNWLHESEIIEPITPKLNVFWIPHSHTLGQWAREERTSWRSARVQKKSVDSHMRSK